MHISQQPRLQRGEGPIVSAHIIVAVALVSLILLVSEYSGISTGSNQRTCTSSEGVCAAVVGGVLVDVFCTL